MTHNNYIYIAVMALVSYAIRILPLTLIRKPIKNRFIQSFLYYVPYVTLAVMTFPAIVNATQSPAAGAMALVVGIAAAWFGASLFQVSVACCAVVFVLELFLQSFNRFLIISLDVLICRYSPLLRAFPALFISEEPHKSFYYPSCFHSQK